MSDIFSIFVTTVCIWAAIKLAKFGWRFFVCFRLARKAGFFDDFFCRDPEIERFVALVAAAEREACAKVCDEFDAENPHIGQGRACAFEIRARGEKP